MKSTLFYSTIECCEMFGVTRTTLYRWSDPKIGNGFPTRVRLGRVKPLFSKTRYGAKFLRRSNCRVGYPKDEVDAYILKLKETGRLSPKEDAPGPDED